MPRKRRQVKPLAAIWEVPDALWARIETLDDPVPQVDTRTQISLFLELRRLAERATRWLLRNRTMPQDFTSAT